MAKPKPPVRASEFRWLSNKLDESALDARLTCRASFMRRSVSCGTRQMGPCLRCRQRAGVDGFGLSSVVNVARKALAAVTTSCVLVPTLRTFTDWALATWPSPVVTLVLTFRNLHDWMHDADAPQVLAALRRALKPGGVLSVEDHRARPNRPQDPRANSGYVRQEYAVTLVGSAGLNLRDPRRSNPTHATRPSGPRASGLCRQCWCSAKLTASNMKAVEEADNFLHKFKKVGA